MKHTLINIALFTGIVGVMFGMQVIDDHGHEQEAARQELAKQRQQDRFAKSAKEMCGNGGWSVDAEGAVVCTVRKALNARRVSL